MPPKICHTAIRLRINVNPNLARAPATHGPTRRRYSGLTQGKPYLMKRARSSVEVASDPPPSVAISCVMLPGMQVRAAPCGFAWALHRDIADGAAGCAGHWP